MVGIWLSKALNSDILIMDVEGTDSRERGDEQVHFDSEASSKSTRTLNVDLRCSHSPYQKSLSLICGNIKSVSIKAQTWVFSKPSLKLTCNFSNNNEGTPQHPQPLTVYHMLIRI